MKTLSNTFWKFSSILVLALVAFGFYYFEPSITLRILAIILSFIAILTIRSVSEILVLLILYLGLFDLYNMRYLLAVPLYLVILLVFGLTIFTFLLWGNLHQILKNLNKDFLWLYSIVTGLIAIEIFLTMTFWPVEPKIKSLAYVIVFYIIARIFYLYVNSVLNLKKIIIFILINLIILGIVLVFNMLMFFGF